MSEPQYSDYSKLSRHKLGLLANQVWIQDPKLLGIRLARYKFVSKMLAGKTNVAEIGCGDGWFSRLVAMEVGELNLFDFDKQFIDSFYASDSCKNTSGYVHDILKGSLEYGPYDAIYSLDCLEHFDCNEQLVFMKNICDSLKDDGVLIVGIPSFESQKYASKASKEGHKGCMNYDEMKKLLLDYFVNVFMLGMNDESLHCGFGPMTHYHLGICTNVK